MPTYITLPVNAGTAVRANVTDALLQADTELVAIRQGNVFAPAVSLTINNDTITLSSGSAVYDLIPQSGTSDQLRTIAGGTGSRIILLRAASGYSVTILNAVGNISLPGSAALTLTATSAAFLYWDGGRWIVVTHSAIGQPATTSSFARIFNADAPPASSNTLDREFTYAQSLGSWAATWNVSSILTTSADAAGGLLTRAVNGGHNLTGLLQSLPAGDFVVETCVSPVLTTGGYTTYSAGLVFTNGTGTAAAATHALQVTASDTSAVVSQNFGSPSATPTDINTSFALGAAAEPIYLRVTRAGSAWTWQWSRDGVAWITTGTGTPTTSSPTHVGIFINAAANTAAVGARFRWFRYQNSATLGGPAIGGRSLAVGTATDDYIVIRGPIGAGGTFTAGAWQTRSLSVKEVDVMQRCTLSGNQFTLVPGQYRISAYAAGYGVGKHLAKLRNVSTNADALMGMPSVAPSGVQTNSLVQGYLLVQTAQTFELQHRCQTTVATEGMGAGTSAELGGESGTSLRIEIWRLAGS